MSVKVKNNTAQILLDTSRNSSLALRFLLDEIHSVAEPITPKDTGSLRQNVKKSVVGLRGSITWGQDYAVYQEKKQFSNYTTSGTGPHFAEKSVESTVRNPINAFKKARLI